MRREAGGALYRLCSGGEVAVLAPLLQLLLEHLPRAADMRPHVPAHLHHHQHEVSKNKPYYHSSRVQSSPTVNQIKSVFFSRCIRAAYTLKMSLLISMNKILLTTISAKKNWLGKTFMPHVMQNPFMCW